MREVAEVTQAAGQTSRRVNARGRRVKPRTNWRSETERDTSLGLRIRAQRNQLGLSLNEVATRAGITRSFLSSVERGLAYPSIPVLRNIAQALDVLVFQLFLGNERVGIVVRKGERTVIRPPGTKMSYELLSPDLQRTMEMIITKFDAGWDGEPHGHDGEECAFVLSGTIAMTIGDDEYELGEGDSIYYDSGIPHKVRVLGDAPAQVLSAITPPTL
jgi:transcriptional regulator with XRE-family HTH domain